MKIKNTSPGGRGFGHGGKVYEVEAGKTMDVPDAIVAEAKKDPGTAAMFESGDLEEVVAKAPEKPAKPETK
jgi:hypothetical protein